MSGGDYHRRVVDWRAKLDEAGREQQRPLWFSDQVAAAQREAHDVIVAASADPRFRGVSKIDASIAPRWLAALDGG